MHARVHFGLWPSIPIIPDVRTTGSIFVGSPGPCTEIKHGFACLGLTKEYCPELYGQYLVKRFPAVSATQLYLARWALAIGASGYSLPQDPESVFAHMPLLQSAPYTQSQATNFVTLCFEDFSLHQFLSCSWSNRERAHRHARDIGSQCRVPSSLFSQAGWALDPQSPCASR